MSSQEGDHGIRPGLYGFQGKSDDDEIPDPVANDMEEDGMS